MDSRLSMVKKSGNVNSARPAFGSGEVGAVGATIVVVTFSADVQATNFATGVLIKKGGVSQSISAAVRQTNHKIVRYTIPAVANGATVTWEYTGGNIQGEVSGLPLSTVTAQAVTNNVAP